MVHAVDRHSNKSLLTPPPLIELERLAERSRLSQPDVAPFIPSTRSMRNLRRRLAPQVIAELVARYQAGEATPALSREYGISKAALLHLLCTENVTMRKQPIAPKDAERAARLYERGLSIVEIVDQIGYSYSTIRTALHENGVAMRPRGIKRRTSS